MLFVLVFGIGVCACGCLIVLVLNILYLVVGGGYYDFWFVMDWCAWCFLFGVVVVCLCLMVVLGIVGGCLRWLDCVGV